MELPERSEIEMAYAARETALRRQYAARKEVAEADFELEQVEAHSIAQNLVVGKNEMERKAGLALLHKAERQRAHTARQALLDAERDFKLAQSRIELIELTVRMAELATRPGAGA